MLSSRFGAGVPAQVLALHLAQAAAVVCVASALADGGLSLPMDPRGLLAVAGIGIVSTVVAMTVFLAGLALVGPTRASVLSSLEVIVTLVLAFVLLGERLGPWQWAGAALILGAVAFQNLGILRRAIMGSFLPEPMKITIAHSPDSDDAFMFYGLAGGGVPTGDLEITHVLSDIETLNRHAREGRHEVTAVSFHAYPHVADKYALMPCGGSIGDGYGPLLVAREPMDPKAVAGKTVAVPGTLTSAYLALQLYAPRVKTRVVPFDRILDEVREGRADVGLVIHEGQLTYGGQGLVRVADLGAWWKDETGLPLPLGGNAVRRDLGPAMMARLTRLVRETVRYSLAHRPQALAYAMTFARGMDPNVADRFVGMWVNDMTVDMGERGRRAVQVFLDRGVEAGVIPKKVALDFVEA